MGIVIQFPGRPGHEPRLTKKQLAAALGRSTRWIELRVGEGMPSWIDNGRRQFYLSDVRAWIHEAAGNR